MSFKASPPVNITGLDKSSVTAAEATIAATAFVSVQTSYMKSTGGKGTATNAAIPNWWSYDRGRLTFGVPTVNTGLTACTIELLGIDINNNQRSLGTSVLNVTTKVFPAIEFDIVPEKYATRVAVVSGGTSPTVTVKSFLQGFNRAGSATS